MNVIFGSNVRRLRTQRGWTQAELARMVGVWQTYISQIENGLTPSIEVAYKIARVLDVSLDDLLTEHATEDTPSA